MVKLLKIIPCIFISIVASAQVAVQAQQAPGRCASSEERPTTRERLDQIGGLAGYSSTEVSRRFEPFSLGSLRGGMSPTRQIGSLGRDQTYTNAPAFTINSNGLEIRGDSIRPATGSRNFVVPDGYGLVRVVVRGVEAARYARSAFYEVKSAPGTISLGEQNKQALGYIAYLGRDSDASRLDSTGYAVPVLVYLTVRDSQFDGRVISRASLEEVALWQTFLCEQRGESVYSTRKFRMSQPFILNEGVYLGRGLSVTASVSSPIYVQYFARRSNPPPRPY